MGNPSLSYVVHLPHPRVTSNGATKLALPIWSTYTSTVVGREVQTGRPSVTCLVAPGVTNQARVTRYKGAVTKLFGGMRDTACDVTRCTRYCRLRNEHYKYDFSLLFHRVPTPSDSTVS